MYKKLLYIGIAAALVIGSTAALTADPVTLIENRAEGGDVSAQVELGNIFLRGEGAPRDVERGLLWLTRASEGPTPDARAALLLAEHYERLPATPANRGNMVKFYRRAAVLGHTTAQARLGRMLLASATDPRLNSESQNQARERGRAMLEHAATAGNAQAAAYLADAYRDGNGLPADAALALRFDHRAADLGDGAVAMRLSQQLLDTKRKDHDIEEGIRYLRIAANAGIPRAMGDLAGRLAEGNGVDKDHAQASFWATKASARGDDEASSLLVALRDQAPPPPSAISEPIISSEERPAADIATDHAPFAPASVTDDPTPSTNGLATRSTPTAASTRDTPVATGAATKEIVAPSSPADSLAFSAGDDSDFGGIGGQTYDELLEEAAALHATVASQQVEILDLRVQLTEKDETISTLTGERDAALALAKTAQSPVESTASTGPAKRFKPAAERGADSVPATVTDHGVHANDLGLASLRAGDLSVAREHFIQAAAAGHAGAMNNLGMLHMQGRGVQPSMSKAIEYFSSAADLGNGVAANNLGFIYHQGRGVPVDRALAITWYQRAVQLGHKASDRQLRAMGVAAIAAN